jgi:hypothetical protein
MQAYIIWPLAIEHIIYEIIHPTPSPHLFLCICFKMRKENNKRDRDMGSNRPPRMRFASCSFRIKLVQRCNLLHSSVHVLKPAVFMAPLRLRLNHTPTALLTTIVGRGGWWWWWWYFWRVCGVARKSHENEGFMVGGGGAWSYNKRLAEISSY